MKIQNTNNLDYILCLTLISEHVNVYKFAAAFCLQDKQLTEDR